MKESIEYLNALLKENDTVIVACSTGPDSMCLLFLMQNLSKKINIICAHINHNVRKQSIKEYNYLEDYCKKNNIVFEGTSINEKYANNFEEQAREFRYNFFESLYKKYNAKYIMTAHHGDDEIETILMRITRGSNLSGYVGIKINDGKYVRPLLYTTKDEIIKCLKDNNIKYFIDKTNKQNIHTRNRYRKFVNNFLKKENKNIHKKYLKFSNELENYDNFINKYIKNKKLINNNKVDLNKLLKEDNLIQRKVIELLIKEIQKDDLLDVSDNVTNEVLKMIASKKSNNHINLNNGYIARKDYNFLSIIKEKNNETYEVLFDDYFENDEWIIAKKDSDKKSNFVLRLDSNDIKLPLIIRNKKDSDKIYVKNLGTKKVKDIFINEKISIDKRKTYPILVDSNNTVLWLPGLKKSKFDKEKNEKYDIILTSERKR